jgi:luciferase family oxidoreductase group 1
VTALALRRSVEALSADDFPEQLGALFRFFQSPAEGDGEVRHRVRAIPAEGNQPDIWLLGSSGFSAQVAGLLGLPFAFAHHFSSANTLPALDLYRSCFRPSQALQEPYCMIGVAVVCAEDEERARWLHGSGRLSMLRLRSGRPSTLPSPEEAAAHDYSGAERAMVVQATSSHVVGDPLSVRSQLAELVRVTGVDELIVTTNVYYHADRLRSYELVAAAVSPEGVPAAPTA